MMKLTKLLWVLHVTRKEEAKNELRILIAKHVRQQTEK
jgi:hypothetical protein